MTGEQLLHGLWAILPEIILLLLGILVITIDLIQRGKTRGRTFGFITIAGALVALAVVFYQMLNQQPQPALAFAGMVRVDLFVQMFRMMFMVALILATLISLDVRGLKTNGEFYGLLIFSTVGMGFMAASNNIVMLYVGLETTSIALYMLAGFIRHSAVSTEAGLKYFLFGAFTSTILLYGLSLLFGFTGGRTGYSEIEAALRQLVAQQETLPIMVALVLITVGFGFKVAAVPFHMWTPDVYEGAPTPISAFISVASKAAGFAVFIRFFLIVFGPLQEQWVGLVAILAAVTMVLGNLVALQQRNFKRMLAYSSIAQAGYLLIGVAAVGELGTAAILFYLAVYVLTNIAAFAVAEIATNATGSELIKDMAGLSRRAPGIAFALLASMLSLAGVPPLAGFFGKFYIFKAAVGYTNPAGQNSLVWLALLGVLTSIIALYYYLVVLKVAYVDRAEGEDVPLRTSGGFKTALTITVAGMIFFGIFATPLYTLSTLAAQAVR
jgi:NADH-quinone oxidoreductase subunit N